MTRRQKLAALAFTAPVTILWLSGVDIFTRSTALGTTVAVSTIIALVVLLYPDEL